LHADKASIVCDRTPWTLTPAFSASLARVLLRGEENQGSEFYFETFLLLVSFITHRNF
jgi:hypothetical protein